MVAHAGLKNEFMEDEKYHNLDMAQIQKETELEWIMVNKYRIEEITS